MHSCMHKLPLLLKLVSVFVLMYYRAIVVQDTEHPLIGITQFVGGLDINDKGEVGPEVGSRHLPCIGAIVPDVSSKVYLHIIVASLGQFVLYLLHCLIPRIRGGVVLQPVHAGRERSPGWFFLSCSFGIHMAYFGIILASLLSQNRLQHPLMKQPQRENAKIFGRARYVAAWQVGSAGGGRGEVKVFGAEVGG